MLRASSSLTPRPPACNRGNSVSCCCWCRWPEFCGIALRRNRSASAAHRALRGGNRCRSCRRSCRDRHALRVPPLAERASAASISSAVLPAAQPGVHLAQSQMYLAVSRVALQFDLASSMPSSALLLSASCPANINLIPRPWACLSAACAQPASPCHIA